MKESEAANHENSLLRAKVEKMTAELGEYKKTLSLMSNNNRSAAPSSNPATFGHAFVSNINDVNFQFEFPKFGSLPGPANGTSDGNRIATSTTSPGSSSANGVKRDSSGQTSPMDKQSPLSSLGQSGFDKQSREDLANLSAGFFNPSPASSGNNNHNGSIGGNSRSSFDSHFAIGAGTSTSSPSSSSNSNMGGASSSCGTSPEPFTQSPMGFKPVDTLTTIGEEQPTLNNSDQGKRV